MPRLARLNLADTGSLYMDFTPGLDGAVNAIFLDSNNKILVGGSFFTIGGASRPYFARLNTNGTNDSTFSAPVLDGQVNAIAIDWYTYKIFIGGSFNGVNGYNFGHIARLHPGGMLDTSYVSSTSGSVDDIQWQLDGKVIIGGFFDQVWSHSAGWQTWHRIARLDANGSLDSSFPAQAGVSDYGVFALGKQYDSYGLNIIVGGNFSTMGGLPRNKLARIAPPVPDIYVASFGGIIHTDGSTRDLGTKLVGSGYTTANFSIQNVGSSLLYGFTGVGGITIDGANAGAFTLSGAGAEWLATGASVPITIFFQPTGQGYHEAWLHIHSNDPDEDPFDIKLTGTGGLPITTWRQQNFTPTQATAGDDADIADPDHDGITNLMEFATAGTPNTNNAAPTSITPPSGSFIEFFYTRNKLAMAELSYDVQWTDDLLATWENSGVTEMMLSDNGSVQQVKALVPKGTTDGRFVRLKVTRQ